MKWLTYNLFVFQNTYNLEQPKLVHSGETIMFEITDTQLVDLEVVLISLSLSSPGHSQVRPEKRDVKILCSLYPV